MTFYMLKARVLAGAPYMAQANREDAVREQEAITP